jgi:hypothetical protein
VGELGEAIAIGEIMDHRRGRSRIKSRDGHVGSFVPPAWLVFAAGVRTRPRSAPKCSACHRRVRRQGRAAFTISLACALSSGEALTGGASATATSRRRSAAAGGRQSGAHRARLARRDDRRLGRGRRLGRRDGGQRRLLGSGRRAAARADAERLCDQPGLHLHSCPRPWRLASRASLRLTSCRQSEARPSRASFVHCAAR